MCVRSLLGRISIILSALFVSPVILVAQETSTSASAQSQVGIVRIIDNVLNFRDNIIRSDTNYVVRPTQTMKFRVSLNCSGADLDVHGNRDGGDVRTRASSEMKITTGFNFQYRGLGIGYSFNPSNLFGKKSSTELDMGLYWNRLGINATYQVAGTYSGTVQVGDKISDLAAGTISQDMIQVGAYYAFNGKRFSYPAAFTQSWIQKRSAGSLLVGASYTKGTLSAQPDSTIGNSKMYFSTSYASVGVGYGYNFVVRKDWLLHISAIPQVIVFSRNKLKVNDEYNKAPHKFPDMLVVGRLAVVKHFEKYFFGLSGVVTLSDIGDRSQLGITNVRWQGKVSVGIKFR